MYSRHVTLQAATPATVTIPADVRKIEVLNVDGQSAVYYTIRGAAATVAGNDTYVLPAAVGGRVHDDARSYSGTVTVQLISAGTPKIAVIGY